MAKARPIEGLDPDGPYAEAAAQIVSVRAAEVSEHTDRVLDTGDIEGVHDMRVATRRLRAALEIFEPCFPATDFRGVLRDVKDLADALGERRDRDVTIVALEGFAERVTTADQPGIESLVAEIRSEQAGANESLAPVVEPERIDALERRIGELVAAAERG